jgi:hypothetical protein
MGNTYFVTDLCSNYRCNSLQAFKLSPNSTAFNTRASINGTTTSLVYSLFFVRSFSYFLFSIAAYIASSLSRILFLVSSLKGLAYFLIAFLTPFYGSSLPSKEAPINF